MARLNSNPLKPVLLGNEGGSMTDPSTGEDVGFTPVTITQFSQRTMTLATGSSQGLVSGANGDKLSALPTASSISVQVGQLAEVAVPVFLASPVNGSVEIYQHVLDTPWELDFAYARIAVGSTNVTLLKNGTGIAGFSNQGVGTAMTTMVGSDSPANMTLNQEDVLGLSLSGTTGNAESMRLSIRANATITP
jgi:hypothetical protein